jgi:hypothetical protein
VEMIRREVARIRLSVSLFIGLTLLGACGSELTLTRPTVGAAVRPTQSATATTSVATPTPSGTPTKRATVTELVAYREAIPFEELITVQLVRENLSEIYKGGYFLGRLPVTNGSDYLVLDFSEQGRIVVKDGASDMAVSWGLYFIKEPETEQTESLGPGSAVFVYSYHVIYFHPEMTIVWADLPAGTQVFLSDLYLTMQRPELSFDELLPPSDRFECVHVVDYEYETGTAYPSKLTGMMCEFVGDTP